MPRSKSTALAMPTKADLWPKQRRDYTWIGPDDKAKALKCLDEVSKNLSTALDTEFPTQGPRKDEVIIWSLSGAANQRFVLDSYWLQPSSPFAEWIEDKKTKLVYFSFAADADVVEQNAKVNCERSFYSDTKVLGWLRNSNKRRISLKEEEQDYLHRWRKGYAQMFGYPRGKKWVVVPPNLLKEGPLPDEMLEVMSQAEWFELFKHYSADDAEGTHALHRLHKVVLTRWGYWDTYQKIDRPYTITLRHFQKRGIPINFAELDRLDTAITQDLIRHKHVLRAFAGKSEMSLDSQSKDLRNLIFEEWGWPEYEDLKTEKGTPQLNKYAWERYSQEHGFKFARLMLPHNKLKTIKNTFINGIRNGTKYGPGADKNILYSEYNQTGTISGRMSSRKFKVRIPFTKTFKRKAPVVIEKEVKAGMNMLNFPNKHNDRFGVRRVVCAPPPDEFAPEGYELICGDYSGFELWMILYWCQKWGIKSKMLKHMLAGDDVHSMTTRVVCDLNDLTLEEIKTLHKDLRDGIGKRCNFGLGYGARKHVFCRILSDNGKNGYWDPRKEHILREVDEIIRKWNDQWPEMLQYQNHCVDLGYSQGWVPTIANRRIWVEEGLRSQDDGTVRHFENLCKNGPAQGSAADIVKMAQNIIERDKVLKALGYKQLFNVYDEILGFAPKRNIEEATRRQEWCMRRPAKYFKMPFVPPVECRHANNWHEGK